MKKLVQLVLVLFVFILSGCATRSTFEVPDHLTPKTQARFLEKQPFWSFRGRIGIISSDSSDTASIYWEKKNQTVTMRIYGGLGTTYAKLTHSPKQTKIELSDDQVLIGQDPDALLYRATGWQIPVKQLQRWILGITNKEQSVTLNESGFLSQFDFNDWKVEYQKYGEFTGLTLPKKLKVTHPELTLKLSIRTWSFDPS